MKKLFVLLMSIAMVGVLGACGVSSGSGAAADNAAGAGSSSGEAHALTVKATNFQFDQPEYHVKKGEKVTITLVEEQGLHGLEIKDYKVNLSKGKETATFTADKAGTFDMKCSVVCGAGHATMVSKLVVE
jgi:cytochrome c oxidase subunit 2